MIRTWLAQRLANFQSAEPFDAVVLVAFGVALVMILLAAAWSWWTRGIESDDVDWIGEGNVRRW